MWFDPHHTRFRADGTRRRVLDTLQYESNDPEDPESPALRVFDDVMAPDSAKDNSVAPTEIEVSNLC